MKKTIILGMSFLAIVMIAAYFFRIKPSTIPQEVANNNYDPIVLYIESGEVSYKKPDQNSFIVATGSVKIPTMTIVETKIGHASVLLPDNSSISLEENTQITVNYAPTKISIFQAFGTTYHRVEKLLAGSTYQVQTPETLAAVRGTKFAVKYDKDTKKTKVSVTEHVVEVSTLNKPSTSTSTNEVKDSRMVNEGEMALVTSNVTATSTITPLKVEISVVKTDSDAEMKATVLKEKTKDVILEDIKKNFKDKGQVRDEIQKQLFKDEDEDGKNDNNTKEDDKKHDSVKTNFEIKSDSMKRDEEKKDRKEIKSEEKRGKEKKEETINEAPKKVALVVEKEKEEEKKESADKQSRTNENNNDNNGSVIQAPQGSAVAKMSEEQYFTKFEPLFITYFYIEDETTFCNIKLSPEEKVNAITSFARNNGYPIGRDLLPFAKALASYCEKKDESLKKTLQSRFDEEYPY